MIHLEVITQANHFESKIKIGANHVNTVYFTRYVTKISPSPARNYILIELPGENSYKVTHNQECTDEFIYIVDSVDTVVPTDLQHLASLFAVGIK